MWNKLKYILYVCTTSLFIISCTGFDINKAIDENKDGVIKQLTDIYDINELLERDGSNTDVDKFRDILGMDDLDAKLKERLATEKFDDKLSKIDGVLEIYKDGFNEKLKTNVLLNKISEFENKLDSLYDSDTTKLTDDELSELKVLFDLKRLEDNILNIYDKSLTPLADIDAKNLDTNDVKLWRALLKVNEIETLLHSKNDSGADNYINGDLSNLSEDDITSLKNVLGISNSVNTDDLKKLLNVKTTTDINDKLLKTLYTKLVLNSKGISEENRLATTTSVYNMINIYNTLTEKDLSEEQLVSLISKLTNNTSGVNNIFVKNNKLVDLLETIKKTYLTSTTFDYTTVTTKGSSDLKGNNKLITGQDFYNQVVILNRLFSLNEYLYENHMDKEIKNINYGLNMLNAMLSIPKVIGSGRVGVAIGIGSPMDKIGLTVGLSYVSPHQNFATKGAISYNNGKVAAATGFSANFVDIEKKENNNDRMRRNYRKLLELEKRINNLSK